ncbi:TonB-dependent receptor plug domain-containing protein [uncultured Thiomicrorhabdus sp.]
MRKTNAFYLTLSCLLLMVPKFAYAEAQLSTVVVNAEPEAEIKADSSEAGKTTLSKEILQTLPKSNGDMNEALMILPEVEVIDAANTSNQAGELKPGKVSILGGAYYQNNFIVDGSPNNSILDPGSTTSNVGQLEGHPQEMYLNLNLIESINVYSSNVSAQFGQFSSGVVEAKTKRAEGEFRAHFGVRYTADSLTKFHVEDQTDFELSRSAADDQPKFEKLNYNLFVNVSVNDSNAFYINYNRATSDIPVLHLDRTENEQRTLDNLLTKWTHFFNDDHILDITFSTAPYSENRLRQNVEDSEYTVNGGGSKLNLELESHFALGSMDSSFSINQSVNSREAPQNYYYWAHTDTFPWGRVYDGNYSRQGGYGDLESEQNRMYLKSDFAFKRMKSGETEHAVKLGAELNRVAATKTRTQDANRYTVSHRDGEAEAGIANLNCGSADACVEGEQYAANKTVYLAGTREAEIVNTGFYLEDSMQWQRLMLRLGARYDYNDFMENHDIAYRSLGKFDLFGNKDIFLTAGLNRYYANTFLSHKLRQSGKNYQEYTRGLLGGYDENGQKIVTPDQWSLGDDYHTDITEYSKLKTPYSDERSIGLEAKLLGGILSMEQVFRDGHDQFTSETSAVADDGHTYTTLTNNGWSKHQSFRIKWQKSWAKHSILASFFKGKGSKNYVEGYDDEADDIDNSAIIYQGQLYSMSDFGTIEDNSPATLKLFYGYQASKGLNIGLFATYTGKYQNFESNSFVLDSVQDSDDANAVRKIQVYRYVDYDPLFKLDLSLSYKYRWLGQTMTFTVDAKNLLDQVQKVDDGTNNYTLGRQFWLGASIDF